MILKIFKQQFKKIFFLVGGWGGDKISTINCIWAISCFFSSLEYVSTTHLKEPAYLYLEVVQT